MDIRAPLCHLIAMITSKVNAKPFRFKTIKQLAQSIPREPALEKLLRMYECLQLDDSSRLAAKGLSIDFPHPDPAWGDQLQAVQQRTRATNVPAGLYPRPFTFFSFPENVSNGSAHYSESTGPRFRNVLDVTSVSSIVSHLEDLDIPNFGVQDLKDPLLSQYLSLQPEQEVLPQLHAMLNSLFNRQLDAIAKREDMKTGTLEGILAYVRFAKVCHLSVKFNSTILTSTDHATAGSRLFTGLSAQVGWSQGPAPYH